MAVLRFTVYTEKKGRTSRLCFIFIFVCISHLDIVRNAFSSAPWCRNLMWTCELWCNPHPERRRYSHVDDIMSLWSGISVFDVFLWASCRASTTSTSNWWNNDLKCVKDTSVLWLYKIGRMHSTIAISCLFLCTFFDMWNRSNTISLITNH